MKQKFSSFDIKVLVKDLNKKLVGFRVINVYDINSKSFLIKLSRGEEKQVLLLESGIRLHSTAFQWPKNMMPSGFSMKLRKHLRGRRLEWLRQLGVDRVVDMQFGSGEAAYHVILELYDRGNLALTDHEYTILNILRPRTTKEDERLCVREAYNIHNALQHAGMLSRERVMEVLAGAKEGENFKKLLSPHLVYGNQLLEHSLSETGLNASSRIGKEFVLERDLDKLMQALRIAEDIFTADHLKGYILQVEEKIAKKVDGPDCDSTSLWIYSEFHPFLFDQHKTSKHIEFGSFDQAIDEFFSKVETQKQERAVTKMESTVLRKLDLIRSDHFKRIEALSKEQLQDRVKARLIEMNVYKVETAMRVIRSALARQVSWEELRRGLAEVAAGGAVAPDGVAEIKALKFESNQITMLLRPEYSDDDDDEEEDGGDDDDARDEVEAALKATLVDIDLSLSAYANACKYYDKKRMAAMKESKTTEASVKALKSAERKTYKALKEVQSVNIINKARKSHWFEKFLWFVSSENYVVIGGRDQQQNEFIVKKYLKPGDIYVHADLHGASSVVIKNPSNTPVSPVTLNEAGCMALCYSAAWEAKVVTTCWWVYHHQVSKTAPSGEYLTTGSFMIRGKKNYLLPSLLVYGFGLLFKVDESSVENHRNERRVRVLEEEGGERRSAATADNDDGNTYSKDEDDKTKDGDGDKEDDGGDGDDGGDDYDGGDDDGEKEEVEKVDVEGDEDFILQAAVVRRKQNYDKKIKKKMAAGKTSAVTSREPKIEDGGFPDTEISYDLEGKGLVGGGVKEGVKEEDGKKAPKVQPLKRGQKGKLKKMKQKYGDQDEEDKAIRISLLKSAGKKPEGKEEEKECMKGMKNNSHNNKINKNIKDKIIKNNNRKDLEKRNLVVKKSDLVVESKAGVVGGGGADDSSVVVVGGGGADDSSVVVVGGGGADDSSIVVGGGEKRVVRFAESSEVISAAGVKEGVAVAGRGDDDDDDLKVEEEEEEEEEDEAEEDLRDEALKSTEALDSFTGCPVEGDELLYCLPVCAPYSTLTNYKFKVKLVPGNCKRGKAAKTFLQIFLHEKSITPVEKNHLKSLKDMDISRNMPGKIKAPHMKKK